MSKQICIAQRKKWFFLLFTSFQESTLRIAAHRRKNKQPQKIRKCLPIKNGSIMFIEDKKFRPFSLPNRQCARNNFRNSPHSCFFFVFFSKSYVWLTGDWTEFLCSQSQRHIHLLWNVCVWTCVKCGQHAKNFSFSPLFTLNGIFDENQYLILTIFL